LAIVLLKLQNRGKNFSGGSLARGEGRILKTGWALLIPGALLVAWLQQASPQPRLTDGIVFRFNENFPSYSADTLRLRSFGYSRMMSSLLWLRFLQQTPPKKVEPDEVSWIYRDLDAVTEIDPDFFPAYEMGGIFLSVITEDKVGAERILLKGTRRFPERWRIRAYLAYHYQVELQKIDLAYEQYKAGARLPGAPPILGIRAASLLSARGQKEEGIRFLEDMLKDTKDPAFRERIQERISKLKGR
jgi:hypothetical protein